MSANEKCVTSCYNCFPFPLHTVLSKSSCIHPGLSFLFTLPNAFLPMPYIPVPSRRLHSSHSSSSSTSCWPVPSLPLPSPVLRPLHAWSPLCHSPLPPFRRPTRPLAHSYFLIPRSSLHTFHLPLPPLSVQPGSSIRLSAIVTRRTPQPEPFTHSHFTLPRSPAVSRDLGPLSLHSSARYFCIHLTARAASPSDPPLSRITLHTPASRCLFSFLLLPFHPNSCGVIPCSASRCPPLRIPHIVLAPSEWRVPY
jgi:hypothetical protein